MFYYYYNSIRIFILIITYVHFCLMLAVWENPHWTGKELKSVHLLFRHGARTPTKSYPNDPHISQKFYPFGYGQLTNIGKQQLFRTGQWLKKRYSNFLDEKFHADIIRAQSTSVTRTIMSLQTVLAGMVPPKANDQWNVNLNWQPIPVVSQSVNKDNLLLITVPCPRYKEAMNEATETVEYKRITKENQQLFDELSNHTGMEVQTPMDIQLLYSILLSEHEYGLKLPDWTQQYFPDRLIPLTELSYLYPVSTVEMKRIKGGPFVKKLIEDWKQKQIENGKNHPKMFMYCGHDMTIVNVLSTINVWKTQLPVYGIMGIFELLKDLQTGEYGIQIYLRINDENGAIPLTIPGCSHFCPLDKFIQLTKNVVPNNLESVCKPKEQNDSIIL